MLAPVKKILYPRKMPHHEQRVLQHVWHWEKVSLYLPYGGIHTTNAVNDTMDTMDLIVGGSHSEESEP